MIYPSNIKEEVRIGYSNPKIRRVLKLYKNAFDVDPEHIGGYYDALLLLKFIKFTEFYARMRNKRAVSIIKKLRKDLSECHPKK